MDEIIRWLLEGDASIAYQTYRDLLDTDRPELQIKAAAGGWGKILLDAQRPDGHWGLKFYQPKWTSTHYTLLDLRNLCIPTETPAVQETVEMLLKEEKGGDGGINPPGSVKQSDVCLNGMFLNYACYFNADPEKLVSVIDYMLDQRLPDGGYNCQFNRKGAVHSSLHSSLSVAEGFTEYLKNGYSYRADEIKSSLGGIRDFIFRHRLFRSDRTGEIIKKDFLRFPYPPRWRYDILRAMDYFRYSETLYAPAMDEAIAIIKSKQKPPGHWNAQASLPGQVHTNFEQAGKPGRWNTLRALRVLKFYC